MVGDRLYPCLHTKYFIYMIVLCVHTHNNIETQCVANFLHTVQNSWIILFVWGSIADKIIWEAKEEEEEEMAKLKERKSTYTCITSREKMKKSESERQ